MPEPRRPIVTYRELVDLAHQKGLTTVTTEIVQIPTPDNGRMAICRATVSMEQDSIAKMYQGTGDADPGNVKPHMANCILRIAETRAIARALRIAVNVADVADVELSEYEEGGQQQRRQPRQRQETSERSAPAQKQAIDANGPMMETQRECIENLCKKRNVNPPDMDGWTWQQAADCIKSLSTQKVA